MNVVGAYITVPGGGGEVTGLAPDVKLPDDMRVGVVTDANDTRLKGNYLFQHGVNSIKLIATGAVLAEGTEPGTQELTDDEMRAAVEAAKANRSWVTAHAHGAEGIKAAIRAGVRSIEHASLIDDEGIALAKARGVWLDMDIYNGDYIEEVGTQTGLARRLSPQEPRDHRRAARGFPQGGEGGCQARPSAPMPASIRMAPMPGSSHTWSATG